MHDFLWYSIAGVVRSSTIFKCECATKILFFQHVDSMKIFPSQGALENIPDYGSRTHDHNVKILGVFQLS